MGPKLVIHVKRPAEAPPPPPHPHDDEGLLPRALGEPDDTLRVRVKRAPPGTVFPLAVAAAAPAKRKGAPRALLSDKAALEAAIAADERYDGRDRSVCAQRARPVLVHGVVTRRSEGRPRRASPPPVAPSLTRRARILIAVARASVVVAARWECISKPRPTKTPEEKVHIDKYWKREGKQYRSLVEVARAFYPEVRFVSYAWREGRGEGQAPSTETRNETGQERGSGGAAGEMGGRQRRDFAPALARARARRPRCRARDVTRGCLALNHCPPPQRPRAFSCFDTSVFVL